MSTALPIAVFDSGAGGLTVVAALQKLLPHERIRYLGDTARLPYGTKSPAVVQKYAAACARFLVEQGTKLLVVACNTASAHALDYLQQTFALPTLGVVGPGAAAGVKRSRTGRIGVVGTEGTIGSGSYRRAIAAAMPGAQIFEQACPLLVPLVEENLLRHPATRMLAREYLQPLLDQHVDTLILGCTHYPLLMPLVTELCGPSVAIVDSASAVAVATQQALQDHGLLAAQRGGADVFFATDVGARLQRVGAACLGHAMGEVQWVDLEPFLCSPAAGGIDGGGSKV